MQSVSFPRTETRSNLSTSQVSTHPRPRLHTDGQAPPRRVALLLRLHSGSLQGQDAAVAGFTLTSLDFLVVAGNHKWVSKDFTLLFAAEQTVKQPQETIPSCFPVCASMMRVYFEMSLMRLISLSSLVLTTHPHSLQGGREPADSSSRLPCHRWPACPCSYWPIGRTTWTKVCG